MQKIEILKEALLKVAENIDCGNSKLPDEQCDAGLDVINKVTNTQAKLSKYQACKYLGVSRATFDNGVREEKLPKGRKEQGFKEIFGLKEDLDRINQ